MEDVGAPFYQNDFSTTFTINRASDLKLSICWNQVDVTASVTADLKKLQSPNHEYSSFIFSEASYS
jgi:hypothetical protein